MLVSDPYLLPLTLPPALPPITNIALNLNLALCHNPTVGNNQPMGIIVLVVLGVAIITPSGNCYIQVGVFRSSCPREQLD